MIAGKDISDLVKIMESMPNPRIIRSKAELHEKLIEGLIVIEFNKQFNDLAGVTLCAFEVQQR